MATSTHLYQYTIPYSSILQLAHRGHGAHWSCFLPSVACPNYPSLRSSLCSSLSEHPAYLVLGTLFSKAITFFYWLVHCLFLPLDNKHIALGWSSVSAPEMFVNERRKGNCTSHVWHDAWHSVWARMNEWMKEWVALGITQQLCHPWPCPQASSFRPLAGWGLQREQKIGHQGSLAAAFLFSPTLQNLLWPFKARKQNQRALDSKDTNYLSKSSPWL